MEVIWEWVEAMAIRKDTGIPEVASWLFGNWWSLRHSIALGSSIDYNFYILRSMLSYSGY